MSAVLDIPGFRRASRLIGVLLAATMALAGPLPALARGGYVHHHVALVCPATSRLGRLIQRISNDCYAFPRPQPAAPKLTEDPAIAGKAASGG
ncbi:MAG: hypothetical protein JO303_07200 [Caulobacteraceae bacterium]|nr:hypothetical protein [Caulobacteraceae bacterium]